MKSIVNVLQNRRVNNNTKAKPIIRKKVYDHKWGQLDQLWQLQSHERHREEDNNMKNMTNKQAMRNNFSTFD
jgi:hypothetical protein